MVGGGRSVTGSMYEPGPGGGVQVKSPSEAGIGLDLILLRVSDLFQPTCWCSSLCCPHMTRSLNASAVFDSACCTLCFA